ncbi:uncharacterized protein B0H18DRAFT_685341 [Fomitopsis serialis]|uniref:uncharacterized protein n=1 Tax=Fomitopsis serialis TaxID=139415 RepID=UPI00200821AD|nr:uncharacterized protein B0H18DRAFT_685341 [Neoantrodia serialis]KAH9917962.1 hypothetical protein B0H18DRAFT_685341 [Neoantrodia serialis]
MALVFGSFGCTTYTSRRACASRWRAHCSSPPDFPSPIHTHRTNQTTLENVSPFLLLRHLPPLPRSSPDAQSLPDAPLEHQLSHAQRRLVRDAHFHVRVYDVGWWKNWAQVAGWDRPWGWVHKLLVGGGCKGDGQTFPRNPRADSMLPAWLLSCLCRQGLIISADVCALTNGCLFPGDYSSAASLTISL